jgi:hypothetical protein
MGGERTEGRVDVGMWYNVMMNKKSEREPGEGGEERG